MQVFKPMQLGLSTRPMEHRKRFGLCVSALLHFPFTEAAQASPTLWTDMSLWNFLATDMPEGPLLDEGVAKLTPEFLVHGHAYAPREADGSPGRRCAVRVRLAGVEKTLAVSGDRAWVDGQATEPAPFERMPLSWDRAYGGADFPNNPLGRGRAPQPQADGRLLRLAPNVEYIRQRQSRPDEAVPPAGLGRIDPMWPQRARFRGTYDENYLKDHSPGFAPDLDWKFFNLAPEDQWLPAPLAGDEPFDLHHLHPGRPHIQGRLPGFVARVFAQYRPESPGAEPKLREVPLRLSTVWFFPHAERGALIFQGLAEVQEDDGSDIIGLMGAVERLGERRDDEHYRQAWERRTDPKDGGLHALRESDLLPDGLVPLDPEFEASKASLAVQGLQGEAQRRRAELIVEDARAQAVAAGKDPDAMGLRMPEAEAPPTLENLADYAQAKRLEAAKDHREALEAAARQILAAEEELQRQGMAPPPPHRGPPVLRGAQQFGELRQQMTGGQPPTPEQARELAELQRKFVELERAQRFEYQQSAHMQPPAPRMPPEQAVSLRAELARAHQRAQEPANQGHPNPMLLLDLTGADLSGLDLRGAQLPGAWLESADLRGANLSGANLDGAVLAHADLRGAILIGCSLRAANLGRAQLEGAVFDRSNLSRAIFMHTRVDQVQMRGVQLGGVNLLESEWGQVDATDAHAVDVNFTKLDLSRCTWDGAQLAGANFLECTLKGASFVRADLSSANFVTCQAQGLRAPGARLRGATFVERTDISGCDLRSADCAQTNFGGMALRGARLEQAQLTGANLRLADLTDADLTHAVAIGALLARARMVRVKARGANFMNAVLQNADLRSADLGASNLHAADLSRVRLDTATSIDGALITRTRIHPRLTPEQQAAHAQADPA
ncbi:DUF2169 domain-containing protein [Xenophilus arseniciresistens]|uniref:DUF2169 domain-containing protein n=1 Tax=Xenophilus arseniciresistens TaxID=1283306 RepID=A0AAE3NDC8_9BURK|nr:DUF2169 domain-containing protein [Xenophilus arseniciresistens]MDA7418766.1 DUF2169 domain-containing protein [Xenophilus arseniciresistens]